MKAYYYAKNLSFKEVTSLFAYNVKDPSLLSQNQRITRLYKNTLRKIMLNTFFTVGSKDWDGMHEEMRLARMDFDKIWNTDDQLAIDAMIEKYELFLEEHYDADAPLHAS